MEKLLKAFLIESRGFAGLAYTHSLPTLLMITGLDSPGWLQVSLGRLSAHGENARYAISPVPLATRYTELLSRELISEADEAAAWLKQRLT
jgi:hypothetical protein